MVTMTSESDKASSSSSKKGQMATVTLAAPITEVAPNSLVYKKVNNAYSLSFYFKLLFRTCVQMESIVERMQGENGGVAVRTVKAFMSKVPSVFTGTDLIAWISKNMEVEDTLDAIHLAHLLSSHGYLFPIDDHALTVKNDGTFYR